MACVLGFGAQSLGIFFLQIPWGNWPKAKGQSPPLLLTRVVVVTDMPGHVTAALPAWVIIMIASVWLFALDIKWDWEICRLEICQR